MKDEIKTVEELNVAIRECYDSLSEPTFDNVIGKLFELYSFNEDEPELKKFSEVYNFLKTTIDEYDAFKVKQKDQLEFITYILCKRNLYWLKDKVLTIVEIVGINGFDSSKGFYNLECKVTVIDYLGKPYNDIRNKKTYLSAGEFIYFNETYKQYMTYDYIRLV